MLIDAIWSAHLVRCRCRVCGYDIPSVRQGTVYRIVSWHPLTKTPECYCPKCMSIDSFEHFDVTQEEFDKLYPDEKYTTKDQVLKMWIKMWKEY